MEIILKLLPCLMTLLIPTAVKGWFPWSCFLAWKFRN